MLGASLSSLRGVGVSSSGVVWTESSAVKRSRDSSFIESGCWVDSSNAKKKSPGRAEEESAPPITLLSRSMAFFSHIRGFRVSVSDQSLVLVDESTVEIDCSVDKNQALNRKKRDSTVTEKEKHWVIEELTARISVNIDPNFTRASWGYIRSNPTHALRSPFSSSQNTPNYARGTPKTLTTINKTAIQINFHAQSRDCRVIILQQSRNEEVAKTFTREDQTADIGI